MKKTNEVSKEEKSWEELLEKAQGQGEDKGDRYFARKFKQLYVVARKSLVALNKARKEIGNEEAYNKAVEVIAPLLEE